MNVLDLFSGIGGFSLGLERAGMKTVAFCEIEEFPRKVLKKHWPNVPIYEDVRELNATRLAADGITGIDVICGGFPCQPFSVAGKRMGAEDNRYLWPEYFRLIEELRPNWVIGENVIGLVNLGLDAVLDDLEGAGYAARTFDIPACGVGAPHIRRRLWIVADAGHARILQSRKSGYVGEEGCKSGGILANGLQGISKPQIKDLADSDSSLSEGNKRAIGSKKERANIVASSWWESESGVCRVANGVPDRSHRLKALGNAVVPQIPEIIGRAIMESAA